MISTVLILLGLSQTCHAPAVVRPRGVKTQELPGLR
jgi:hypothetical protein